MTAHPPQEGPESLPIASGRQTFTAAWELLRRRPVLLCSAILVLILGAACGLVAPWAIGRLVDMIGEGGARAEAVWWLGGAILGAALLAAIASGVGIVLAARLFETGLAELRERFLDRALALPQGRVEQAGTGELVSRASDDVAEVSDSIPQIVPAFTGALFSILVSLAGMAAIDVRLAGALAVTLPVYLLTMRWYLRTAPGIYAAERSANAVRAHHVLASLRGLDSVLAYRLSERHGARIARSSWEVVRWAQRARIVQNMFFARLNLAEFLGTGALLLVSFWLVGIGAVTVGAATTAVLVFLRLFDPINQLLFVLDDAQSAAASLARIVGVARTSPDRGKEGADDAGETGVPLRSETPLGRGRSDAAVAQLSGVDFSYDSAQERSSPVLHEIDLRIASGERVALVGASGAGKSTIAMLLAGLQKPTRGLVRRPQRTVLLAQDTHVFAGTLADCLRLARPAATEARLLEALSIVEADAMLASLPEGLDTVVGHGGHPLTAAQAQQIALARLVLSEPRLAILDEATADADSADASLLERASLAATESRATLIIAHRLSQAAACDRIVVLDRGRVVESGDHARLIARGGAYAELWRAWARGRARSEDPEAPGTFS